MGRRRDTLLSPGALSGVEALFWVESIYIFFSGRFRDITLLCCFHVNAFESLWTLLWF